MFLEHVNMTVANLEQTIAFYQNLLGFDVRWRGVSSNGRAAAHVGDEKCYLALFEATASGSPDHDYARPGINHFGFVVDDLEAVRKKLEAAGVTPHLEGDYDPGRRLYFYDPDGVEVELVEYEKAPANC